MRLKSFCALCWTIEKLSSLLFRNSENRPCRLFSSDYSDSRIGRVITVTVEKKKSPRKTSSKTVKKTSSKKAE